jgi:hypothetical protein
MRDFVLESVLTCPHCGLAKQETLPTDACLFYYECSNCKTLIRPNPESIASLLINWRMQRIVDRRQISALSPGF